MAASARLCASALPISCLKGVGSRAYAETGWGKAAHEVEANGESVGDDLPPASSMASMASFLRWERSVGSIPVMTSLLFMSSDAFIVTDSVGRSLCVSVGP